MKKNILIIAVLLIFVGGYFYLNSNQAQDQESESGQKEIVLNRGNNGDLDSLDPLTCDGSWESNVFYDAFENLVSADPYGKIIPGMAESWEISDDGKTYVFHIRKDAKWSNGDALTAHDFVFAMQNLVNPEKAYTYSWVLYDVVNGKGIGEGQIKDLSELGVKAVDDHTLQINLTKSTPYFLELLSYPTGAPLPKKLIDKLGDEWRNPENIISNGPYHIVEWKPTQHVISVKNEHYWDKDSVQIDRIIYHSTEDPEANIRMFRSGELDMIYQLDPSKIDWIVENYNDEFYSNPFLATYFYPINAAQKPFDDIRVRKALSLSVDRELLVEKVIKHGFAANYSIVPEGMPGYEQQTLEYIDMPMDERVAEAKRLLAEAGFGPENPLTFTLTFNTSKEHEKIAVTIADLWRRHLGAKVEIANIETKVHFSNLKSGDFQVARAGWGADYSDPQNFLQSFEKDSAFNYGHYQDSEIDRLMNLAANTVDLDERAQILQQAEKRALSLYTVIPLFIFERTYLVSNKIEGYVPNIKDDYRTKYLSIKE